MFTVVNGVLTDSAVSYSANELITLELQPKLIGYIFN